MYVLISHSYYMARTQHDDKEVKPVTSHSNFIKHKHTKYCKGELLQNWKNSNPYCQMWLSAVRSFIISCNWVLTE